MKKEKILILSFIAGLVIGGILRALFFSKSSGSDGWATTLAFLSWPVTVMTQAILLETQKGILIVHNNAVASSVGMDGLAFAIGIHYAIKKHEKRK